MPAAIVTGRVQRTLNWLVGKPGAGLPAPQSNAIVGSLRTMSGGPLSVWLPKYDPAHPVPAGTAVHGEVAEPGQGAAEAFVVLESHRVLAGGERTSVCHSVGPWSIHLSSRSAPST